MGPIIEFIEEEGPVIEEEAAPVVEKIGSELEAAAKEVEAEGEAIIKKIESVFSNGEAGEVTTQCEATQAAQSQAIADSLASSNPGVQLEGQIAEGLRNAGITIERFQAPVGPNGSIGEVDVETSQAIIESTVSASGKLAQITKLLTNPAMNPTAKPVVLYAPNYGGAASQSIVNAGAYVVRNMKELTSLLAKLGEK